MRKRDLMQAILKDLAANPDSTAAQIAARLVPQGFTWTRTDGDGFGDDDLPTPNADAVRVTYTTANVLHALWRLLRGTPKVVATGDIDNPASTWALPA